MSPFLFYFFNRTLHRKDTDGMKRLVIGILAHVDSGKTTLSEALLYRSGTLRKLGRVDHKDAFLDTDSLERARGITIFSKQAVIKLPDVELTLLDTPGHVDFSAEAERALQVMDCAILVVSGTDGIQSHTETLWRLLQRHGVPVFLFVNKTDLAGVDRKQRMEELQRRFHSGCVDMLGEQYLDEVALCNETLLETVMEGRSPSDQQLAEAIARRELFPCYFGSALKLEGVDELLDALSRFTKQPPERKEFGARIFKISRSEDGQRLTWLKVTGGELKVKTELASREDSRKQWRAKADQLRLYSGVKFQLLNVAPAGTVCAVTGLADSYPGEGLGFEPDAAPPSLEPVMRHRVILPPGCDVHTVLRQFRELEQEDPLLRVVWDERLSTLFLQLMGEVQLEVLQSLIQRRFGLEVSFDEGGILYKETINARVEGVGHFEPLRHYAEVHLLLEPGEPGSGVQIDTNCREDDLAANWQRLILTHLAEKQHLGPLTGSPLTDVRITLCSGRAHPKHTEGGDFRQATYRAVRQGLRTAQARNACVLLEPWYEFTMRLPQESVGKALADMPRLCAEFEPPVTQGEDTLISGRAPVSELRGYAKELASYTRGRGQLQCLPGGYAPCHNSEEVIATIGYDVDGDIQNTADSVFCSHGAGVLVRWDQAPSRMHLPSILAREERLSREEPESSPAQAGEAYKKMMVTDKELMEIFERTYGPIKRDPIQAMRRVKKPESPRTVHVPARPRTQGPEHLLVDGYNVIFSWESLNKLAQENLEAARHRLMDILCNYAGYRKIIPILVFDAYKVKGAQREVEQYHNLYVVYTKEAETADMYIEKTTHEIAKKYNTRVVTSDATEQLIILGSGAMRVSSRAFEKEVKAVENEIRQYLSSQILS